MLFDVLSILFDLFEVLLFELSFLLIN